MPDPIYATIEMDRKANAEFIRLCDSEDALEEAGIELVTAPDDHRTPEMVAVVNAGISARRSLAKVVPTTPAGLAAYLDYLLKESFGLGGDFYFDGKHETLEFLKSLHRAVHGMTGLQPMQTPALAVTDTYADADLLALEAKIMAVAHEAEISGPAYNLAEDAIFAWRRENPRPIWADHNNKEVEKIMRQVVDHIEQGGNLDSFKLVAPVITEKTRAALGEVLQTIKLQNEWDRRERPQKLIAAAMRPRRNGARIAVRFVS